MAPMAVNPILVQAVAGQKGRGAHLSPEQPARWVAEVESSIAILINTWDDLERPFLDYVANLTGKPVWGVGPLLPDQYWQSADLLLGEREIRPKRDSNYTQNEIIEWLDSKPRGSVFYVSFGSEVSPSTEEYPELANALEESNWPFIWVIQKNSGRPGPSGGDEGGFLSHCGWNSTVEAIVRGVPFLGWPIRGDQYYNAKLLVSHLKVGTMVSEGYPADMVKKNDILQGIETVMTNEEMRKRAAAHRLHGFPASSVASLDAFGDFISKRGE
ncbi:hypothetical protein F0562_011918 [Nyssa sinensis]|uniref:UDP-glycosyltransferases domain-containing protein n=1 Tax=Nyssa sinensis TaxID=561372 RepID=A0A5J4ZRC6_9ASTE|nr:hypothetical protein F0562_011918 [Nyssa sinensis]